jgi:hypothetical protein
MGSGTGRGEDFRSPAEKNLSWRLLSPMLQQSGEPRTRVPDEDVFGWLIEPCRLVDVSLVAPDGPGDFRGSHPVLAPAIKACQAALFALIIDAARSM